MPLADRGTQRAEFFKTLDATIQKAYRSLRRTQARYKRDFDKRVCRINTRLEPRNFVYLNLTDGGKTSNKLASSAVGPYRVLANDRRTITIDCDGITEQVSTDRCVYAPPPMDALRGTTTTPCDPGDKVRESTHYAVENLLKHREMEEGTTDILIKWADYDQPTWTARTQIPEELVSRYALRLRRRTPYENLLKKCDGKIRPLRASHFGYFEFLIHVWVRAA